MSAICGVLGFDGRPWAVQDLARVRQTLAPLGRDGGGAWTGSAGACSVAIAAALRHPDPDDRADAQPLTSADGSLTIVADVRLYDRASLAKAVALAPAAPDSALALAAYERWGEAALERLVGDFALAIVDRRRGGVLIARDYLGARPLVVHRRNGVVAFASNALALTGLEGVGHDLDTDGVAETLALSYTSRRTFVRGVEWLPPAHAMWVDARGARTFKWWRADPLEISERTPAEHVAELREAFDAAVSDRLQRRGGRVGATTSGGLDSSSATATAARQLAPEPLLSYTAAPPPGWSSPAERPGWDADESPLVRELAAMHGNISPTFIHVDPVRWSLFERHEALWELGAGPVRNPCNALWIDALWRRAAADGVTTLFTGALGNVAFSADGQEWLAQLIRRGRLRAAGREARAWSAASADDLSRALARWVAFEMLPARAKRPIRRAGGRGDPRASWLAQTALRPDVAAGLDLAVHVPSTDDLHPPTARETAILALQMASTQADVQAARTALTGVEPRDPTGDRRVVEVAMRQPEWVRRRRGVTRAVARQAMADRLPQSIAHRSRRGEQLPDWLDAITARRVEIEGELEAAREHETSRALLDLDRLARLVRDWPERTARADPVVMRDYRLALLRALNVSRYMRWFEARAARERVEAAGS